MVNASETAIFKGRIAKRLILALVLISSRFTAITTATQLYLDYQRGLDDIERGFSLVRSSYLDGVTNSMWSFDDDTAVPGVMYYYWVEAVNICSTGTPVLQADAADGMSGNMVGPSGMNATGGTNCGYVEVSWDNMPLANNYVVWRSETNDFATATAFDGTSSNVYQDETVEDKTLYFYWVTSDSQFCVGEDERPHGGCHRRKG